MRVYVFKSYMQTSFTYIHWEDYCACLRLRLQVLYILPLPT